VSASHAVTMPASSVSLRSTALRCARACTVPSMNQLQLDQQLATDVANPSAGAASNEEHKSRQSVLTAIVLTAALSLHSILEGEHACWRNPQMSDRRYPCLMIRSRTWCSGERGQRCNSAHR
jgi:hypothetical protein